MITDELRRLQMGPSIEMQRNKLGLACYIASCDEKSTEVLKRVRDALNIVLSQDVRHWPEYEEWRQMLPDWLVRRFTAQLTMEEALNRRELPFEVQQTFDWSLENWIYWFEPENRQWHWWDARVVDQNTINVYLEASDFPFASDALRWLFLVAGALEFQEEELEGDNDQKCLPTYPV